MANRQRYCREARSLVASSLPFSGLLHLSTCLLCPSHLIIPRAALAIPTAQPDPPPTRSWRPVTVASCKLPASDAPICAPTLATVCQVNMGAKIAACRAELRGSAAPVAASGGGEVLFISTHHHQLCCLPCLFVMPNTPNKRRGLSIRLIALPWPENSLRTDPCGCSLASSCCRCCCSRCRCRCFSFI